MGGPDPASAAGATLAEIHAANELAMQVWRQDQLSAQTYLSSRGFDLRTITPLGYDIGHAGSDGPVRGALEALGEILGKYDHERMLDRLFAAFCIGK